jgi:hypothetical protein
MNERLELYAYLIATSVVIVFLKVVLMKIFDLRSF